MPTIGRDILEAVDPPIQMAWIHASNIVNQAPNCNEIARALESIPFTVVVDGFMTDTAERADLILPCELVLEKEDLVGSFLHNYTNYVGPSVTAPGQARSDHWILSELGKRLDPPILLAEAGDYLKESLDSPYLDTSLDDLRKKGFVRSNRPEIAYENLQFDHPDGKYHLPVELHDEPNPPPDFPLHLLTLVNRKFIHSQVLPEDHDLPPLVRVSSDSKALEGIDLNKDVFLVSQVGRLKVRVKTVEGLHPEVVIYRRGDWVKLGGGANQLIEARLTDMGDGAAFYSQCVRLEN
ncbi:molybdopterin-dependent oxidoreductase [Thermodesulfobacteriota bacterium]